MANKIKDQEIIDSAANVMGVWFERGWTPSDVFKALTLIFTAHYKMIADPPDLGDLLNLFCDVVRADFAPHPNDPTH